MAFDMIAALFDRGRKRGKGPSGCVPAQGIKQPRGGPDALFASSVPADFDAGCWLRTRKTFIANPQVQGCCCEALEPSARTMHRSLHKVSDHKLGQGKV